MSDSSLDRQTEQTPSCHQSCGAKGHLVHMLLMVAGCLMIPLLFIGLAPKLGINANLSWLVVLLCPLMHVAMMVPMLFNKKNTDPKKD